MEITTKRFGLIQVSDDLLIDLPTGLLGFPEATRFALIRPREDSSLFWLQSVSDPALAFVVADPADFVDGYQVPVRKDVAAELELDEAALGDDWQTLVICNRTDGWLTGNLLGPLLIHVDSRRGTQVVLTDQKWGTRQPLVDLQPQPMRKSA